MKEAGHGGNADTYICAVRSLVKFVGREKVMLSEITAKFLQNWADWINKQPNVTRGDEGYIQQSEKRVQR